MKKVLFILSFAFILINYCSGQVQYIAGSYADAVATSTGVPGLPLLNYTPSAGTDRLLLFSLMYERDHSGAKGSNWANPKAVGGVDPSVSIGGSVMTRLRTLSYYQYQGGNSTGNALMSVEMIVFGMLEANIPAGANDFIITGVNTPGHSGDEASVSAMMFENVAGLNYLASNGCENCNLIGLTGLDPQSADNMIVTLAALGSDRDVSPGVGNTLVGKVTANSGGSGYNKFTEGDGIALASQYVGGTTALQSPSFSASGAADIFGAVEVGFRLIANDVLPVELISFEVNGEGDDNYLFWSAVSEINNEKFEVEYSIDGFNWDKIATINGKGNYFGQSDYSFLHENVKCQSCYYRLKQIDFNGSSEYSPTRFVKRDADKKLFVYPNPARDVLNVEVNHKINSVQIFDAQGKLVQYMASGINSGLLSIDVFSLQKGSYFLVLNGDEKNLVRSFAKL